MFDELIWHPHRMLLNGLVFRLEHFKTDDWNGGSEWFPFYKTKPSVEQFAKFWSLMKDSCVSNLFELGIWDGGSIAFWFEYFHPQKHVAIDFSTRGDSAYFQRYIASRSAGDGIRTYWGVDQGDARRLHEIVQSEFCGLLDVVIDDGSHLYAPTKTSFEVLFPLLRPGGLYIIEDWAWAHWKEFQAPDHPWADETELTRLIFELLGATGSSSTLVSHLSIFEGFAVIERGETRTVGDFHLDDPSRDAKRRRRNQTRGSSQTAFW